MSIYIENPFIMDSFILLIPILVNHHLFFLFANPIRTKMSIYKSNGRKSGYHMTFIWTSNGIIMAIMIGTISASLSSTSQLSSPSPSLSSLQSPSSDMDELPRSLYRNSKYVIIIWIFCFVWEWNFYHFVLVFFSFDIAIV